MKRMKPANNTEVSITPSAFLTTAEAASFTGYTADHIGLLRRRGALAGEKRGRDWFITRESLEAYVNSKPKAGRPRI
jgi:hypothetical protein